MTQPPERADSPDSRAENVRTLAAICIVIAALKLAAGLLVPVLLAAFFAMALVPLARWIHKRGVPATLSILLAFVVGVLLVVVLGLLVADATSGADEALPKYEAQLSGIVNDATAWLRDRGIDVPEGGIASGVDPSRALTLASDLIGSVGSVLSDAIIVLMAMLFMLFEAAAVTGGLGASGQAKGGAQAMLERVTKSVTDYLSVKTVISLLTGLCFGILCAVVGLDFAVLWGLLVFLLNYIPNIGSAIAAVPPTLLALLQFGPGAAALVLGGNIAINGFLGNVVEPKMMGQKVGLSTLTIFLGLIFWSWVFGPVGTVLSVPLTIVAKMLAEKPTAQTAAA